MICKATFENIDRLLEITSACANHMVGQGIFQWNDHYPNRLSFEQDVKREELFLYELDGEVMGCIVVSSLMDDVYASVQWLTPNQNNIYIHRLAIHPSCQGKGLARQLMDFAEEKSRRENKISIRLDTFSKNSRNQLFYEQRGYNRLEDIYFPKQSEFPFYCYELIL